MSVLISFSGLPGVGKTTVASALAREISAVYVRVDSIEAALKDSTLQIHPAEEKSILNRSDQSCERDETKRDRSLASMYVRMMNERFHDRRARQNGSRS